MLQDFVEQLHVLDARWTAAVRGRRRRRCAADRRGLGPPSAAASAATPSITIVPSARRHPRSGAISTRSCPSAAICGRSRRRPRAAIASELVATCALDAAWPGLRRGGEHQLPGAAMVQPHRRAPRTEEGIGLDRERLERGGDAQRRRNPAREPEEQLLDAAVKRRLVSEARELERERELRARARAPRGDRVSARIAATTRNAFGAASASGTISAAVAFSRPRSPGRSARSRTQAMCGAPDCFERRSLRRRPARSRRDRRNRARKWPCSRPEGPPAAEGRIATRRCPQGPSGEAPAADPRAGLLARPPGPGWRRGCAGAWNRDEGILSRSACGRGEAIKMT